MAVRTVLVVCVTVFVSSDRLAPPLFAQASCEAGVLSQLEGESQRFLNDASDAAGNWVEEKVHDAAFKTARELTKNNVTSQKILDFREKWNEWKSQVESAKAALDEIQSCAPNYAFSCLMQQSKTTNENIRRWLASMQSESTQEIIKRVEQVSALYTNYVARAFSNAQTGIDSYLNNCATIAEQRIQTQATNGAPKSGMSAGKIAAVAASGAGAVAAWMYYDKTMEESDALLREFGNLTTPSSSPVQNTPSTPAPPTGVRGFDGTYDFEFVRTMPGGGQQTVSVPRYLILTNGRLTTSENTINGTVDANGVVDAVGVCPINSEPADWDGRMSTNGTGSGTYTCRFGGISRTWRAFNRR